ncbi:hypothetical protein [Streptomyces sp. H27-C3]|uniref:hypothetical protein n=1 Tax=Streptomyces sp. H27-C3 TaxID=3046305 RepID=UPI0024B903A1|nr:hypothetical protein [Streptomyces sp. H27-C3]MDJ0460604.1 hypothetical protein [Streptomyces sp. H27-C3]
MNERQHVIAQAAGSVDDVIEQLETGQQPAAVDVAIMRASLRAALDAGVHPTEVNAHRRT